MITSLLRSWCLELPETKQTFSGQKEVYKVNNKTFAIINQDQISLKCNTDGYQKAILLNEIVPLKGLSQHNWITIESPHDLMIEDLVEFIINSYESVVKTLPVKTRDRLLKNIKHDIDSPWKDALSEFFKEFMEFFYPEIAKKIDWTKAPVFMDKELSKLMKDAASGKKYVDKLAKVWRKDGIEAWVLLHVEVQGQTQDIFAERMFVYSNRLKETYRMPVASLAILADDDPNWRPCAYSEEFWGCRKTFEFHIIKLLDYRSKWNELEKSRNPFAMVVMAHLKMLETKKDKSRRLQWKIELTKLLYAKGFSKDQIFALYKFIDWLLVLPRDLSENYNKTISQYKEEKKMRFLTSFELYGMEKGMEKGMTKGMTKGIEGQVNLLNQLKDMKILQKSQYNKMIQPLQLQLQEIQSQSQKRF